MGQEDSIKSFRRGGSAVELQVAKTIGKNPPPKLRVERTKAQPSIPSNTVAPPEDKTMLTTSYQTDAFATRMNRSFIKGPR